MIFQKYLDKASSAHAGCYMNPRAHAKTCIEYHSQQVEKLHALIDEKAPDRAAEWKEQVAAKYEALFLAYLNSLSRCMSSAITGGSNFPVKANAKNHERNNKREKELRDYYGAQVERINKYQRDQQRAGIDPVMDLATKIEKRRARQTLMLEANKIIRGKGTDESKIAALVAAGISQAIASDLLKPDFAGRIGFADYELTNNRAEIKRLEGRLVVERQKAEKAQADVSAGGFTEYAIPWGMIILNTLEDRLQIIFEEKPGFDMREMLKHRGYRWSPTAGAWQRKLTQNAIYDVEQLFQIKIPAGHDQSKND